MGHKRTFLEVCVMSALPPKADIADRDHNVRFVPKAGIAHFIRLLVQRRCAITQEP